MEVDLVLSTSIVGMDIRMSNLDICVSKLDIRMSRLNIRMSRLDIRVSVPTILVLMLFQFFPQVKCSPSHLYLREILFPELNVQIFSFHELKFGAYNIMNYGIR